MPDSNRTTPCYTITEYKKGLTERIDEAVAKKEAKGIDTETLLKEQQYQVCSLNKAEANWQLYRHINYCVVTGAVTESGLVKDWIKDIKKEDEVLKKKLKALAKELKSARDLFTSVIEESCMFQNALEDEAHCHDHSDIYDKMVSLGIPEQLETIRKDGDACHKKIKAAFIGAREIVGIQARTDYSSLEEAEKTLTDQMKQLADDINSNLKYSEDQWKKAGTGFIELKQKLKTASYENCKAAGHLAGLEEMEGAYLSCFCNTGTEPTDCDFKCPSSPDLALEKIRNYCEPTPNEKCPEQTGPPAQGPSTDPDAGTTVQVD